MRTLQKLFAVLLTVALIGGQPVVALADVSGSADCGTLATSGVDDGCCGSAAMNGSTCSIACGMSSAALVSELRAPLATLVHAAPIASSQQSIQCVSGPPDPAPPKAHLR